jgi:curved DNA-binding protein CbpA
VSQLLKVLEMSGRPSLTQVRAQYFKLAQKYHPDVGGNNPDKFIEVQSAYQRLVELQQLLEDEAGKRDKLNEIRQKIRKEKE